VQGVKEGSPLAEPIFVALRAPGGPDGRHGRTALVGVTSLPGSKPRPGPRWRKEVKKAPKPELAGAGN